MKRFFLFLCLFTITELRSQTPGYQGKKISLSLGGDVTLISKIYSPVIHDTLIPYRDDFSRPRFFPELRLALVLNRSLELGGCYKEIASAYLVDRIYLLRTGYTELFLRKYEKARGGLAPVGSWVQGGLAFLQTNFNIKPEMESKKKIYSGALTFGMGIQRAYGSRWLLEGGWELVIPPQVFMSDMKLAPGYYQGINDYYKNISNASLSSIKLRLGFLVY